VKQSAHRLQNKEKEMEPVQARKTRIALTSLFLAVAAVGLTLSGCGGTGEEADLAPAARSSAQHGRGNGTVSARLGGFDGILAFLEGSVVPAELADPEIAPFFTHLTETPGEIERCLAMLLDHDLGGDSPHSGAVLTGGHQCRSSMSNIHRGLNIPDRIVTKFIVIAGQQAALAGVAPADIQEIADVLDRYRGGVRNK
jgi:hypothetical protein